MAIGIDRMGHVVEQILSLYRHSSEYDLRQLTKLDLGALLQEVIADQYPAIQVKQQEISLIGNTPCMVNGREFALKTLFQNIINNANKYTPVLGKIIVSTSSDATAIVCVVEDSGPGLAKAEYQRVFERFYRVGGDQHNTGVLGCGLGLAIVHHIAELHHAQITLMPSESLGGLKVVVTFPLKVGG